MEFNKLSREEEHVILDKGTEAPFSGEYDSLFDEGIYICRRCDAPLYHSRDKFDSGCGWPSFDDEITLAVKRQPDADGRRTEILCASCGGHLGHVFKGERKTSKDTRHCVNSLSIRFIPMKNLETAVFGGGCFWCTEAIFSRLTGVLLVTPGYAGGKTENPTYEEVCSGRTGHAEVVRITFGPSKISFDALLDVFFHTHDPTTLNRQGNDVGAQYRSTILCTTGAQKSAAQHKIEELRDKFERLIVTKVEPLNEFYEAEANHRDYYKRESEQPYCRAVIGPKMEHFRELYGKLMRS